MEVKEFGKIKPASPRHRAEVSMQTGFPSPATHYLEPTIDLSEALVEHKEATFFMRIGASRWEALGIYPNDVLIIDRSLHFSRGKMAVVVSDGNFDVIPYPAPHEKHQEDPASFQLWGVITYVIHPV